MEKIIKNLANMKVWIDFSFPPPSEFKTEAESMKFVAEAMNRCLYLLKVGAATAPNAETAKTGYTKPRAIIVGHMVQLTKLYEGALIHICGPQPELTRLFFRPILEVAMNIKHLIKSRGQLRPSTSTASSPNELRIFRELENKAKERSLTPIEHRINALLLSQLEKDSISRTESACTDNEKTRRNFVSMQITMMHYICTYFKRKQIGFIGGGMMFVHIISSEQVTITRLICVLTSPNRDWDVS